MYLSDRRIVLISGRSRIFLGAIDPVGTRGGGGVGLALYFAKFPKNSFSTSPRSATANYFQYLDTKNMNENIQTSVNDNAMCNANISFDLFLSSFIPSAECLSI